MPRGSAPNERRGGRRRNTPNRRTVLTARILALASAHPNASAPALQRALIADRALPADTRVAIARRVAAKEQKAKRSAEGNRGQRLAALWTIAGDQSVPEKERRQAAYGAAELLLPKVASRSRWPQAMPDEFGFAAHPDIAREYRDAFVTLRTSVLTTAQKKKLLARMALIRARAPCPCPKDYQVKHMREDARRLSEFVGKRNEKVPLTPAEDAEEAHRRLRFDSYRYGPETAGCVRLEALKEKQGGDQPWRQRRRLSRRDLAELRLLRLLYPPIAPEAKPEPRELDETHYHPFKDEMPAADGNFYPADSKLRPANPIVTDDDFGEFVDVPPFIVGNPNYPANHTLAAPGDIGRIVDTDPAPREPNE